MDVEEFRKHGYGVIDRICDYYSKDLPNYPVLSKVSPGYLAPLLPSEMPENAEPWETIKEDFEKLIIPGVMHWQHPQFYGFFPANASFPSMLGEMYSNMINCIGFNWMCSPSCTELETIVLDWTAKLIGLDECFLSKGTGGGVIQGSASSAVLTATIAAKVRVLKKYAKKGIEENTLIPKLVAYTSTETHSCTAKAVNILGLKLRILPVDDDFALKGSTLLTTLKEDVKKGLVPFFFTGTIGTTSTAATDHLDEISKILIDYPDVWFHVDAAYAGSAMCCPEFRHHLKGTEKADSFSFNLHKWGLVNFDCSPMYVRDRRPLNESMAINPHFLLYNEAERGLVTDYRHWQIPLGRRFRSLKVWFTLRTYGSRGYREHIRRHVALAKIVQNKIESSPDLFEMMAPPKFSLIVFRLHPKNFDDKDDLNQLNKDFHDLLMKKYDTLLTQTSLKGKFSLRLAIGSVWTKESHVIDTWNKMLEASKLVISSTQIGRVTTANHFDLCPLKHLSINDTVIGSQCKSN